MKKVYLFLWYVMTPVLIFIYVLNEPLLNSMIMHPSFIFVALAAFFNSIMDSIENEHIINTRFPIRIGKRETWDKAKKVFNYKIDFWHLAKSLMVFCLIFSILFYKPMVNYWVDFLLLGYWWNLIFNLFYNRIWRI